MNVNLIPAPTGHRTVITTIGLTQDIIQEVLRTFELSKHQLYAFAPELVRQDKVSTLKNIWRFVRENIRYIRDPAGVQYLKTPARTWSDRFGDCKSYSIMIASICYNLGIACAFRFVSYGSGDYSHVYVIVPDDKKTYVLDACLSMFDAEKPYTKKQDYMVTITRLEGLSTELNRYDISGLPPVSEEELELRSLKSNLLLEKQKAYAANGYVNDATIAGINAAIDYVNEMTEAMLDADGSRIEAIAGEWFAGGYHVTCMVPVAPNELTSVENYVRQLRRWRIAQVCQCRG